MYSPHKGVSLVICRKVHFSFVTITTKVVNELI